jgi:hypothetical protein
MQRLESWFVEGQCVQMADLETYIGQVWSPDVRPLTEEAWRCYNSGAIRASIAATWTAVTADIITKIIRLADDGDAEAIPFRTSVEQVQALGITVNGVKAMQKVEEALLAQAEKFELIDSIGARELGRIKEDRNLCVHPSLRSLGDVYKPRPEVARGHLAVALTTLLIHPPVQGRKVLEQFMAYICDPFFVPTPPHIQITFFDRVRSATRVNVVKFAAKHALLEIAPPSTVQLHPTEHAERMADALNAFALRDRQLVHEVMVDLSSRFQPLDGSLQLRALVRLGEQDYFWAAVDQALADRLNGLLTAAPLPAGQWEALSAETATYLALVRSDQARSRLPILETRFAAMEWWHRIAIVAAHPDPYFVPALAELITQAAGWRLGEAAGQLAVQHAPFLTPQTLEAVLLGWATNVNCRTASLMPGLVVRLFHATAHIGASRADAFRGFLANVRSIEDQNSHFRCPELEAALHTAGYM